MKLSTKSRYAVTAMLDIAQHDNAHPLTLQDIALNQNISLSYIEQIFSKLRQSDLVKGIRGPGGGYCLARPANLISMTDIINAVDPEEAEPAYSEKSARNTPAELMWRQLSSKLHDFLQDIHLSDFVEDSMSPLSYFDSIKSTPAYQISHMFKPRTSLSNTAFN